MGLYGSTQRNSVLIKMPEEVKEIGIDTPGTNDYLYIKCEEIKLVNIKVKASGDALIALSFCSDNIIIPVYEILIGTSGNTKTIIYYNKRAVAQVDTQLILSPKEYRHFWLSWKNKTITFGRMGNPQGFITWENSQDTSSDDTPLNIIGLKTNRCYGNWEISVEPEGTNEKNVVHNKLGKSSNNYNDLIDLFQNNFPKENSEKEQLSKYQSQFK